jgi:hypothetical protein
MPLPYKPGSHGPEIEYWQAWFERAYESYAPPEDGYYGNDEVAAVKEMQRRLEFAEADQTGIFDEKTAAAAGYVPPPVDLRPIMFTVEGHQSDMWRGPVADTANQLEKEGLCYHAPTGYNNGTIPFDNASGINELARRVGQTVQDNGTPFPQGTPWSLGIFSQGATIGTDFYIDYLAPGKPLEWRTPDLKGVLAYGNPSRQTDSIAPWARSLIKKTGTHGLEPYRRLGMSGMPDKPDIWMDVYREGDIFAENGDDLEGAIAAAVYLAVARGDVFSNPYSLAAQIARFFTAPVEMVFAIVMEMINGVVFLAGQPNPHYSPYDINPGIDWMRSRLAS